MSTPSEHPNGSPTDAHPEPSEQPNCSPTDAHPEPEQHGSTPRSTPLPDPLPDPTEGKSEAVQVKPSEPSPLLHSSINSSKEGEEFNSKDSAHVVPSPDCPSSTRSQPLPNSSTDVSKPVQPFPLNPIGRRSESTLRTPSPPQPYFPVKRLYSSIDTSNDKHEKSNSKERRFRRLHAIKQYSGNKDLGEQQVDEEAMRAAKRRNVVVLSSVGEHEHPPSLQATSSVQGYHPTLLPFDLSHGDESTADPVHVQEHLPSLPGVSTVQPCRPTASSLSFDFSRVTPPAVPLATKPRSNPPAVMRTISGPPPIRRETRPDYTTMDAPAQLPHKTIHHQIQELPLSFQATPTVQNRHPSSLSVDISEITPKCLPEPLPSLRATSSSYRSLDNSQVDWSMSRPSSGDLIDLRYSPQPQSASTVTKSAWIPLKRAMKRRSNTHGTFSRDTTPSRETSAGSGDVTPRRENSITVSDIERFERSKSGITVPGQRPSADLSSDIEVDAYPYHHVRYDGARVPWSDSPLSSNPHPAPPPSPFSPLPPSSPRIDSRVTPRSPLSTSSLPFNGRRPQLQALSETPWDDSSVERGSQAPTPRNSNSVPGYRAQPRLEKSSLPQASSQPATDNDKMISIILQTFQRFDARLTNIESSLHSTSDNPAASKSDEEEIDLYEGGSEDEPINRTRRTRQASTPARRSNNSRTSKSFPKERHRRTQEENEYNSTIRQLMRELLTPIEYREDGTTVVEDDELVTPIHSPPSEEELLQFSKGNITGPTFEDFSIAWLPPGMGRTGAVKQLRDTAHRWNEEAAYVFATTFLDRLKAHHYFPTCDNWKSEWKERDELERRFLSKLQNYNGTFEAQHCNGATVSEENRTLYSEKGTARHKRLNANARRTSLFKMRQETIALSRKATQEQRRQYLQVLKTVGVGGMTSDESDIDDSERKCRVVKVWRSKGIGQIFRCVDRAYDSQNLLGRDKRGMDKRKFGPPSTRVNTNAVIGLPMNFYDSEWMKNLSSAEKRRLKAKPPVDLPPLLDI